MTEQGKKQYEDDLREVRTVIKESQAEYSKQLLALSSAVLALSVSLTKSVVEIQHAVFVPLLYCAWGALMVVILMELISIRISITAHKIYRDQLYKLADGHEVPTNPTWRDSLISRFSFGATLAFFFGVAALVLFSMLNIHKERLMPKPDDVLGWIEVQRSKPTTEMNRRSIGDSVEVQRRPQPEPVNPPVAPQVSPEEKKDK